MNRSRLAALIAACAAAARRCALARVERFAVIIGNNRGAARRAPLRYAETDARARRTTCCASSAASQPANIVLLRGENADDGPRTLIAINERIRERARRPDAQVDAARVLLGPRRRRALHLGGSALRLTELAQLVRGSAAQLPRWSCSTRAARARSRASRAARVAPPFALPEARPPARASPS